MTIFSIDTDGNNKFEPWKKDFWFKILVMTIAICIVCWIWGADSPSDGKPYIAGPLYAVILSIVISILNGFIKPVLSIFSMPLIMSTFGLFSLVINAVIILIADWLMGSKFEINGFWNAFLFSIVVSVLSFLLDLPRRVKKLKDHISTKYDPYREGGRKNAEGGFTEYEDVTEQDNEEQTSKEENNTER